MRSAPKIVLMFSILLTCQVAIGDAPQSAGGKSLTDVLLDNVFLLTLLFLFVSALATAILGARARDRCLKDLHSYRVMLEMENNKLIWGTLELYSTGLVLNYREPAIDSEGHMETSFIFYKDEWGNLKGLYRCADELAPGELERRQRAIRRTYQPSIYHRMSRRLQNLYNTLRDAVAQSIGLVIGQAKKAAPASEILTTQDKAITQIGNRVVGATATAYDPILERQIGKKVVVEVEQGGIREEYPGILKEYSANFLEVLSVTRPIEFKLPLPASGAFGEYRHIKISRDGKVLRLVNKGRCPVDLLRLTGKNSEQKIGQTLAPEEMWEREIDASAPEGMKIVVMVAGDVDIVLPRANARVRHSGEKEAFNWRAFFGLK